MNEDTPSLDLDLEPTAPLVLHPGDTLAVYAPPILDTPVTIHVLDRTGRCTAVLHCDLSDPDRFRIEAIRFVAPPH
jgi:hypothetical protein